jgi:peptide/nickel transport system permease protein
MGLARLARGQVLALKERPFVHAARLSGTPWHRMWRWHYLPELRGPVSQDLAIRLGELILAESTLSYLGLGMPATRPTWGVMVADGLRSMTDAWWLSLAPGVVIVSVVVALALIGDEISATACDEAAV